MIKYAFYMEKKNGVTKLSDIFHLLPGIKKKKNEASIDSPYLFECYFSGKVHVYTTFKG